MHVKMLQKKRLHCKSVARKVGFVYICFDQLQKCMLKYLNTCSLISIDKSSCLCGPAPGSIPERIFMFDFLCFVVVDVVLFFCRKITFLS